MWKRRSQRVKQWQDLVGRPQHIVLVTCPLFLSFPLLSIYICTFFFQHIITHLNLVFSFFLGRWICWWGSVPGLRQKKEEDIDTAPQLDTSGGLSCLTRRRGTGAIARVGFSLFFYLLSIWLSVPLYIPTPCISLSFHLSGVGPAEKS